MTRQHVGRCVGIVGALCSTIGCTIVLLAFVSGIFEPGLMRLALVVLWPIALVLVQLVVLSVRVMVTLGRRPDGKRPVELASVYGVLGVLVSLWARLSFPVMWFAIALLAVAASGAVAARLCYQGACPEEPM